jgi:hypothetical protein
MFRHDNKQFIGRSIYGAISAVFIIFLLFPAITQAATYYVDNTCSNNGDGTSQICASSPGSAGPFNSVANMQAKSGGFLGDDNIYLKKGQTYREKLTIPSSGSSGHVITFGSYGTGDNPIIVGSDPLDVSGYAFSVNTEDIDIFSTTPNFNITDSVTLNYRNFIASSSISASASAIKIRVYASDTVNLNITGSAIGPATSATSTQSMTRITWDGGSNSTTIVAGSFKDSDTTTYSLDNTVSQIVSFYSTARNFKIKTAYTGNDLYSKAIASDESQSTSVSGYTRTGDGKYAVLAKIISVGASYEDTYDGTQATDPGWVWEDTVPLDHKDSIAEVSGEEGSWWWNSTTTKLYIHASDGSIVSSSGKTYEINGRSDCIDTNTKNYLTIDGIDCTRTAGVESTIGGIRVTGSYTTIQNLESYSNRRHCLAFAYASSTYNTGTNLNLHDSLDTTAFAIYQSHYNTLQNSNIYNALSVTLNDGVIVVHGGSTNNTFKNNEIYVTNSDPHQLVNIFDVGNTDNLFENNYFHGNSMYGFYSYATGTFNVSILGNLFNGSQMTSFPLYMRYGDGAAIYNNTIIGNSSVYYPLTLGLNATNVIVKNNIFYGDVQGLSIDETAKTGFISDYNIWHDTSAWVWGSSTYLTFADWKAGSGQDSHSIDSDPGFKDAANSDYTLTETSAAIDAGTDSSTPTTDYIDMGRYDYPFTTNTGAGVGYYDIGAYEYTGIHSGTTSTVSSSLAISYSATPTTTATAVPLKVVPSGSSVNVLIDTWNTSGAYYKKWKESSSSSTITTAHTVGDLAASRIYQVEVDDILITTTTADSSGMINFTYSGGYSDKVFEVVDVLPTITSISSDKTNGTYGADEVIDIDVTFSEAVTSTGNIIVVFETGATDRVCTFSVANATTGTCNYTVHAGDVSSDLNATVTGTISDITGNVMSNFTPATGLSANKALVISAAVLSSGVGGGSSYVPVVTIAPTSTPPATSTIPTNPVTNPSTPDASCPTIISGDMVKVIGKPAIYAVNKYLQTLYFPSGDEFKSWRPTYGGYKSITQACFDSLNVPNSYPAAVNYRPGSYLIKRTSSDQLYVIEPNNTLSKISSTTAKSLYSASAYTGGTGYKVMTIADPFWPHYINRASDITSTKVHPGMLIKTNDIIYYIDDNNRLREVTDVGFIANQFQQRFVRVVPASAIQGLTIGDKITSEIKTLTDKTQSGE